jgi:hypothetical protein
LATRSGHGNRSLLDVRVVYAGHNVPQEAPDAFADAILHAHRHS